MHFLTSVPLLLGKGVNVWLGLVLIGLLAFQITTGIIMFRGRRNLFRYHRFNGLFLIPLMAFVHLYYGIGVWFFGFQYGK